MSVKSNPNAEQYVNPPTYPDVKANVSKSATSPSVTPISASSFYSQSNLLLIFGFLAVFSVLGVVSGTSAFLDIIVLSSIALYATFLYFDDTGLKSTAIDELKRELLDANTIIYVGIVLALLHLFTFFASRIGSSPMSIGLMIGFGWIYMAILLLVQFTMSVFKIPVVDMIFNDLYKVMPNSAAVVEPEVKPVSQDEVFNISNNLYTYEDAQNICTAYGARLATYDDMEDAYNNGAEWCNYGWSEGQMAYFPTQKSTWTELQKSEKRKNNCGRPGINGGYMANPNIRFGVNCFGKKPKASDADLARLSARHTQAAPLTPEEVIVNEKVKYWKDNAEKMLVINSHDRKKWSAY